ncbi:unnamed protein product [Phyllotreta striolata]|uniref:Uncharacterized protein n=1 Tax=Phyllotreta striolata TaxID=444603 RepID=A0A9N9TUS7_PHYSR|nr:unnamed protein product [Phyllotreta striolata]
MEDLEGSFTFEEDLKDLDKHTNEHLDAAEIAYRTCRLASTIHGCLHLSHLAKVSKNQTYVDLLSLPKKHYLEQTMVPVLANGLAVIAKDRPVQPVTALALFLLKHGMLYETDVERKFEVKFDQAGKGTKNDKLSKQSSF